VRLAVAASPEVAIPTLELLLEQGFDLRAVITQPDRPSGRGLSVKESPVSKWAAMHQLPVHKPVSQEELALCVKEFDLVITIGFGLLIKEEVLNIPKYGFINLHFSLLPSWRGAAPVQRSIEAGDKQTGVTVFKLDKGMDTGPIYRQQKIEIPNGVTTPKLLTELALIGAPLVLDTISAIKANEPPTPQSDNGASKAEKLSKDEGRINWHESADAIDRKIRAFFPSPGTWTTFRSEPIKLEKVSISTQSLLQPAQIHVINKQLFVGTGTTAIVLEEVRPSGKASMSAQSWANGARISENESFE